MTSSDNQIKRSTPKFFGALIRLGLLGSLLSATSVFSASALFFDLLSNFRIQYIVLILPVLILALWYRRFPAALILAACFLLHAVTVIVSLYPSAATSAAAGPVIRVMTSNLFSSNNDYANHINRIREIDPDLIVFQEYTPAWETELSAALDDYPYKVAEVLDHPFGIALYSKVPLTESKVVSLEVSTRPSVEAIATFGDVSLQVFGTHPPPPTSVAWYQERNRNLLQIAQRYSASEDPVVILGDLNITPWSAHFRRFLKSGNFDHSRRGIGILPTWPAPVTALHIPIDHIVFNDKVVVNGMESVEGLQSDHITVWADIQIK